MHIYQQAMAQPKQRDGKQRFRAYVYRETYAKLEETTVKTWLDWFPEKEFGRFYWSKPFRHEIRVGSLELDVIFVAMEDLQDAKSHFKSLEPSLIWFNEGQFADFGVIAEAVDRVSPPRYPAVKDGGCVWGGLILDTNAPPADHWIPIMRGDTPPPDWMTEEQKRAEKAPKLGVLHAAAGPDRDFRERRSPGAIGRQPGCREPDLPAAEFLQGEDRRQDEKLDRRQHHEPLVGGGRRQAGLSRFPPRPACGEQAHRADPGPADHRRPRLRPAAGGAVLPELARRWYVLREIIGRDMGANKFAPIVKGDLSTHFPGSSFTSGATRRAAIRARPTTPRRSRCSRRTGCGCGRPRGNNLDSLRKEAVETVLCRTIEGKPSLLVDPSCTTFITGMSGGYHFRRLQTSGERYADEPNKNQYSTFARRSNTPCSAAARGGRHDEGLGAAENRADAHPYNPFTPHDRRSRPQTSGAGDAARPRPTRSDPAPLADASDCG
jgi:hypothetical protein